MEKRIVGIVSSNTAPKSTNVLWVKGNKIKIYNNGKWSNVENTTSGNTTPPSTNENNFLLVDVSDVTSGTVVNGLGDQVFQAYKNNTLMILKYKRNNLIEYGVATVSIESVGTDFIYSTVELKNENVTVKVIYYSDVNGYTKDRVTITPVSAVNLANYYKKGDISPVYLNLTSTDTISNANFSKILRWSTSSEFSPGVLVLFKINNAVYSLQCLEMVEFNQGTNTYKLVFGDENIKYIYKYYYTSGNVSFKEKEIINYAEKIAELETRLQALES